MSNDQTRATLEAALAKSRAAGADSGAVATDTTMQIAASDNDPDMGRGVDLVDEIDWCLTYGLNDQRVAACLERCRAYALTDGTLTFNALRIANTVRLPLFKNPHGQLAHSIPDGSDWSPAQWLQAVLGELGEYANFRKKFERGDLTADQFEIHAGKELADVQTYLDILARRCLDVAGNPHPNGINLGEATRKKFNEVSGRVGADVFIGANGRVGLQSARRFWPAGSESFASVSAPGAPQTEAARDVLIERQRQWQIEGWTPAHDDAYGKNEMSVAAACYALWADSWPVAGQPPTQWPWPDAWWKPKDHRRDMVRAAALLIAEIERIDRAAASGTPK